MNDEECVQWIVRGKGEQDEEIQVRNMRGRKTVYHNRAVFLLSPAPLFAAYDQQIPEIHFYAALYRVILLPSGDIEESVSSTIKLQGENLNIRTKSTCSEEKRIVEFIINYSPIDKKNLTSADQQTLRTISTIMLHFIEEEGYNRLDHVYHTYTYLCPDYLRI